VRAQRRGGALPAASRAAPVFFKPLRAPLADAAWHAFEATADVQDKLFVQQAREAMARRGHTLDDAGMKALMAQLDIKCLYRTNASKKRKLAFIGVRLRAAAPAAIALLTPIQSPVPAPKPGRTEPQEEAVPSPQEEEVPPQEEEAPQEEAPQEEAPQEEAPQEEAPQEEAPQEEALQEVLESSETESELPLSTLSESDSEAPPQSETESEEAPPPPVPTPAVFDLVAAVAAAERDGAAGSEAITKMCKTLKAIVRKHVTVDGEVNYKVLSVSAPDAWLPEAFMRRYRPGLVIRFEMHLSEMGYMMMRIHSTIKECCDDRLTASAPPPANA